MKSKITLSIYGIFIIVILGLIILLLTSSNLQMNLNLQRGSKQTIDKTEDGYIIHESGDYELGKDIEEGIYTFKLIGEGDELASVQLNITTFDEDQEAIFKNILPPFKIGHENYNNIEFLGTNQEFKVTLPEDETLELTKQDDYIPLNLQSIEPGTYFGGTSFNTGTYTIYPDQYEYYSVDDGKIIASPLNKAKDYYVDDGAMFMINPIGANTEDKEDKMVKTEGEYNNDLKYVAKEGTSEIELYVTNTVYVGDKEDVEDEYTFYIEPVLYSFENDNDSFTMNYLPRNSQSEDQKQKLQCFEKCSSVEISLQKGDIIEIPVSFGPTEVEGIDEYSRKDGIKVYLNGIEKKKKYTNEEDELNNDRVIRYSSNGYYDIDYIEYGEEAELNQDDILIQYS